MLNMVRPRLLASSEDLANYLIGSHASEHYQICCVLEAAGKLDENLFIRAAKWAYHADTVVNCQLVLDTEQPYWKHRISCSRQEICSIVETEDISYAVQSFMRASIDPCREALVQVRLFRKTDRDFLCIKISHACSDAVGLKEYTALFLEAYNALAEGKAFAPKVSDHKRSLRLILEHFSVNNYQELPKDEVIKPSPTTGFPSLSGECSMPCWTTGFIRKNEYNKIKAYAKVHNVTLNDMLLTAFARAYPQVTRQGDEYAIIVTVDLRRFADKVSPVANFSSGILVNVPNVSGQSFKDTLNKVSGMMKKVKKGLPGVHQSLELDAHSRVSYDSFQKRILDTRIKGMKAGFCPPLFSNTGIFSKELLRFGGVDIVNAYIVPPPMFAPGFLFAISTYNEQLAVSAGYYQPAVPKETMDVFIKAMLRELSAYY